jgi:hypothetical protein
MKKCLVLMFLWLIPMSVQIQSNNAFFTWYQTEIEIPVGSSLEPFLNLPYATLNSPYVDDSIYYEKNGVNYTFQSTIQTNIVKTYRLDYKVYSPKYNVQSIQSITFKVVDLVPPVFTKLPILEVPVFSKNVDYTQGIRYSDNYSTTSKVTLKVDSSAVNLNQVGLFPVLYTLIDESGNETKATSYVWVKDYYAPMITQKKPLVIEPFSTWVWGDFFIIKDNYDTIPHILIYDDEVEYHKLGVYPIQIETFDSSGNSYLFETTLEIKDQTPPELFLKATQLITPLGTPLDLRSLVIKVKDNYAKIDLEDIVITSDLDISKVGFYEAIYEVFDDANLKTTLKVDIYVVYKEKPLITFQPMSIQKGYPYDLLNGIEVHGQLDLKISIFDTNIMQKGGTYDVVYLVVDPYGNHAYFIRQVILIETPTEIDNTGIILGGSSIALIIGLFSFWIWKKRRS